MINISIWADMWKLNTSLFDSLAPGRHQCNFRKVIFKLNYEIALRWMPHVLTDDQAITWVNVDSDLCRQMASLGLNDLT